MTCPWCNSEMKGKSKDFIYIKKEPIGVYMCEHCGGWTDKESIEKDTKHE